MVVPTIVHRQITAMNAYKVALGIFFALFATLCNAQIRGINVHLGAGQTSLRLDYGARLDGETFDAAQALFAVAKGPRHTVGCVFSGVADFRCHPARSRIDTDRGAGTTFTSLLDGRQPGGPRKLRLEDINLQFSSGMVVGVQSYYHDVGERRYDLGLRGRWNDVGLTLTATRPGLQLQREVRGLDLHLRVGASSAGEVAAVLAVRNRW